LLSPCSCCRPALAVALLLLSPCSCCRPALAVALVYWPNWGWRQKVIMPLKTFMKFSWCVHCCGMVNDYYYYGTMQLINQRTRPTWKNCFTLSYLCFWTNKSWKINSFLKIRIFFIIYFILYHIILTTGNGSTPPFIYFFSMRYRYRSVPYNTYSSIYRIIKPSNFANAISLCHCEAQIVNPLVSWSLA
jgi:hypothetical protein